MMEHLIKKQTIELALPKKVDAFNMQHQAGKHFRNEVLPLLEKVFDELCTDETLIEINQLEIDLGEISENEMVQSTWGDAILARIRKQVFDMLGRNAGETKVTRTPKALGIVRQWLFYMQKGYLPWNALHADQGWYQQVLEALAVDFASVTALKQLITKNPGARLRIAMQHNDNFLIALLEIITARKQDEIMVAIDEMQLLFKWVEPGIDQVDKTSFTREGLWGQVLGISVNGSNETTLQLIEKVLLLNLPDAAIWKPKLPQLASRLRVLLPVVNKIEQKTGRIDKEKLPAVKAINKEKNDQPVESIDEDGIFTEHAGLVLIHPFVGRLFKKLELVNEGKFETLLKQQKALYLLHFVATGFPAAEEYNLVVAKVLCNWPLDMPVEKDIVLSAGEMEEADSMLEAAIDQWAVLKSTSLAGLREGFLQRNGKITKRKDKLYLQVETMAIDVLLDQLPWNVSMIKLPWMKNLLWVEWR